MALISLTLSLYIFTFCKALSSSYVSWSVLAINSPFFFIGFLCCYCNNPLSIWTCWWRLESSETCICNPCIFSLNWETSNSLISSPSSLTFYGMLIGWESTSDPHASSFFPRVVEGPVEPWNSSSNVLRKGRSCICCSLIFGMFSKDLDRGT